MPRHNRPRFVTLAQRLRQTYPNALDPTALIQRREVMVNGVIVTNPASLVAADAAVRLCEHRPPRGQLKLAAAIDRFDVVVRGRTAVDIGASTGGFTLALLLAGAHRVYAIDAGHGQLLGSLRLDARVVNLENTNLGNLHHDLVPEPVDVVTVDLSYLALADAAPQFEALDMAANADMIVLVKPMFELGLAAPPADESLRHKAVEAATAALDQSGWELRQTMESPVRGSHGAIEHLAHLRRRSRSDQFTRDVTATIAWPAARRAFGGRDGERSAIDRRCSGAELKCNPSQRASGLGRLVSGVQ